tara:strand:- start:48978 stop:50021 length:1044 start_codon:yes stop_codon:yes gene_type:complete
MIPSSLAEAFMFQSKACVVLGSPFMGQLCRLLANRDWPDTPLRQRYFAWAGDIGPSAQSLPLRLTGGLHALALSGDVLSASYPPHVVDDDILWSAVGDAMLRENVGLNSWVDSPPQTNEVRRAAVLIAVGHFLANQYGLPIRLSELGASSGLNLMWDKYGLDIDGARYGPSEATVVLSPAWTGPLPPTTTPVVAARRGVDLNPLNPKLSKDALRLRAYLWPDQPNRLKLTEAAIAGFDATVDQADAIDWLADRLDPEPGTTHLIYHTIAWQYFPAEVQARGKAIIATAGANTTPQAPLAWFGMEPDGRGPGAAMVLRLWPGNLTINLGRVDFHGRWVQWQTASSSVH